MTPSTSTSLLARRLGVRRRRVGERRAPVQGDDVLGRGGGGARDHLAHGRVGCGDRLALVVGEGEDVQQQRLLDLGAVEEVAAALGRQARVVGQHDRRAEQRVVVIGRQHREGVDALGLRRLQRRRRSARRRCVRTGCVESRLCRQRARAVEALGDRRRVVHAQHHAPATLAEVLGRHPDAPVEAADLERLDVRRRGEVGERPAGRVEPARHAPGGPRRRPAGSGPPRSAPRRRPPARRPASAACRTCSACLGA